MVTLSAEADSYISAASKATNYGTASLLKLVTQNPVDDPNDIGSKRVLLVFDQADIVSALGPGGTLISASLELKVNPDSATGWGSGGQEVGAYRLAQSWVEGSVSWNCRYGISPGCTAWSSGYYASSPTDVFTHTNGMSGWVQFDVTEDVQDFLEPNGPANYGWLLRNVDAWTGGAVDYQSREYPYLGARPKPPNPRLVLEVLPDTTPPAITHTLSEPPNAAGWHDDDVTVDFECTDEQSGIAFCTSPPGVEVTTEGENQLVVGYAQDHAGNDANDVVTIHLDRTAPVLTIVRPAEGVLTSAATVQVAGKVTELLSGIDSVTCNGQEAEIIGPTYACDVALSAGTNTITVQATDGAGNVGTKVGHVTRIVAPPLDGSVATDFEDAVEWIYKDPNSMQVGADPNSIEPRRVAVVRGRVMDAEGEALPQVQVSVPGHPEYGYTLTRLDGMFDLAVNGGSALVVDLQKEGYLPAQRQVAVPWRDYVWVKDTVLREPADPNQVDLSWGQMQVLRGPEVADEDGTRQATLLFPADTEVRVYGADPNTPLFTLDEQIHVRATEYTVGDLGPLAMPGLLPPTSAYTYAVSLLIDEAEDPNALSVKFSQPVYFYVENFAGIPTGTQVPVGYYDRQKAAWLPEQDGRVIEIVGISGALAELDIDGSAGAEDPNELATLGIDAEERETLALLYPGAATVPQGLWRVQLHHLTDYDFNWGSDDPAPPPNSPGPTPGGFSCPTKRQGSIIECQTQVLRESIPLVGAPYFLNYHSGRTPGYRPEDTLSLPLHDGTWPQDLERIEVEVEVGGRLYSYQFDPNEWDDPQERIFEFVWDRKDAYGRTLQGRHPAVVRLDWVYDAYYQAPDPNQVPSFGLPGMGPMEGEVPARRDVGRQVEWHTHLGAWDARGQGLGGWSLSAHHAYDPVGRVLYYGNGEQRFLRSTEQVITTFAGGSLDPNDGTVDGIPAVEAYLDEPLGVAAGPDGTLYIADEDLHLVRRVDPDGMIHTFAGGGNPPPGQVGDGGPATEAKLSGPQDVDVGPDGSVYIADRGNNRIRRVLLDGTITSVAGTGTGGFSGDGEQAKGAKLNQPTDIAVAPDGTLYIADLFNERVRRVAPDGTITTYAGNGTTSGSGDDGWPATVTSVNHPEGVALGRDGSLYIAEWQNNRVRRVGTDGIITTFAGGGSPSPPSIGDGGPATAAVLNQPRRVAVALDGSVYIVENGFPKDRVRRVTPDGIVNTVVGTGAQSFDGDNGPPTLAKLHDPRGVAVGPDGDLYVADSTNHRIRRVDPVLPGYTEENKIIPAADLSEVYVFDRQGRHLRTVHPLTGQTLLSFGYDEAGQLTSIAQKVDDPNENLVTSIERDANEPTALLVGPYGQSTLLQFDPLQHGYLVQVTDPNGQSYTMDYETDQDKAGLMIGWTDPEQNLHTFGYLDGRLILDEDPIEAGGSTTLEREEDANGFHVNVTTAEQRRWVYQVEYDPDGTEVRTNTPPTELDTVEERRVGGSRTFLWPDGSFRETAIGPDPRFGMQAPVTTSTLTTGGHQLQVVESRQVDLEDPLDPLSILSATTTRTVNGKTWTSEYVRDPNDPNDPNLGTITTTSPLQRKQFTTLDALGRAIEVKVPGLTSVQFDYDPQGRLKTIQQGSRLMTLDYDTSGRLATVTDPNSQTVDFEYDAANRVTMQVLQDGKSVEMSYDKNGNLETLTPPDSATSSVVHGFSYTPVDLVEDYTPPAVEGSGTNLTHSIYNLDRQLELLTLPDANAPSVATVDPEYDAAGRLDTLTTPSRLVDYDYYAIDAQGNGASPGRLHTISVAQDPNSTITYTYEGMFLKKEQWSGAVAGSVEYGYDPNDLRINSLKVNGLSSTPLQYDDDGLLVGAGDWDLTPDPSNGLLLGTELVDVTDVIGYNDFGEVEDYEAEHDLTTLLYSAHYERDPLGHIDDRTETIGGVTLAVDYVYDARGRLTDVIEDPNRVVHYEYDENGSRLSVTVDGNMVSAAYDDQDRLLTYGTLALTYTPRGSLLSKTDTAPDPDETTDYEYDLQGNLIGVTLPDSREIEYVVDGANRRIGKKVDGVLEQGFLYAGQLHIVAELDGNNAVVSRFVPGGMIRGGVTYRILRDHLGSVRLVVNADTGAIVQRLDYDEFGKVLTDWIALGFHPVPFGFAGGLYDRDTGLVRFGARDYDPEVGRWTAKDPILFSGGDTNLYGYVLNDPVNSKDPTGLFPAAQLCEAAVIAGTGAASDGPLPFGDIGGLIAAYIFLCHEGIICGDSRELPPLSFMTPGPQCSISEQSGCGPATERSTQEKDPCNRPFFTCIANCREWIKQEGIADRPGINLFCTSECSICRNECDVWGPGKCTDDPFHFWPTE